MIDEKEVLKILKRYEGRMNPTAYFGLEADIVNIEALEQEPRCKDCKWWKDSDGKYRRGCGAESHCPINRREVYEGNGYCFLYEPQESEE